MIIGVCREEGFRALISGGFMAPLAYGTIVKSKCEAKRTRRRTRRGSSTEVSFEDSGVRILLTAMFVG